MLTFRDRERATKAINTLLSEQTAPWIIVSGQSKIGKTEFVRKIAAGDSETVLCEPNCSNRYAYMLIKAICPKRQALREAICTYAEGNTKAQMRLDLSRINSPQNKKAWSKQLDYINLSTHDFYDAPLK